MKRIFIVLLSTFLLFGCYNEEKEADKSKMKIETLEIFMFMKNIKNGKL